MKKIILLVVLSSCGVSNLKKSKTQIPPPIKNQATAVNDTAILQSTGFPVTFAKLKNREGQICVTIFDQKDGFPDSADSAYYLGCQQMTDFSDTWKFDNLDLNSTYAIAAFHDANSNSELDTRPILGNLRIPTEGFGFSKNPGLRIGPPNFASTSFKPKDFLKGITINLLYPI